jgi:hypothetical protein
MQWQRPSSTRDCEQTAMRRAAVLNGRAAMAGIAHAAQQPMLQPPRWIRTNMHRSANHGCACGAPVAVLHRRKKRGLH